MQQPCLKKNVLPFERMLVALTDDDTDCRLVRYVAELAGREDPLEIHFMQNLEQTANVARTLVKLREFVAGTFRAPAAHKVSCKVSYHAGVRGFLECAAECGSEVVVIRKRRGYLRELRALLRRSPAAVWVVPEDPLPRLDRILAVVDDGPVSGLAARTAAALSRRFGSAPLAILRPYFNESLDGSSKCERRALWQAEERCCHLVAGLELGDFEVLPIVEHGAVLANAVERAALRTCASLVVIASRPYTPAASALFKRDIERTIEQLPVPALLVKDGGPSLNVWATLAEGGFHNRPEPQFG